MLLKRIKTQLIGGMLYKLVSVISNFLLVSLTVRYLGNVEFGFFIALTSIATWVFLFDLGLAKGMRNKITIALEDQNFLLIRKMIGYSYAFNFLASSILLLFIFTLFSCFDFDFEHYQVKSFDLVFLILAIIFKFIFSPITQLNFATHKSHHNIFLECSVLLLAVFSYLILNNVDLSYGRTSVAIIVFSISSVLPFIFGTFTFFWLNKHLKPIFNLDHKRNINLVKDGITILVIQLLSLIFVGFDRLILFRFSGPESVSTYEISYKLMSIIMLPFSIFIAPIWSLVSQARKNSDFPLINDIVSKFNTLFFILILLVIFIVYFNGFILTIWLGNEMSVSTIDLLLVGCVILSIIYSTFYTDVFIGLDNFKFPIFLIFFGLLSKYLIIFLYNDTLDVKVLCVSTTLGYIFYFILAPSLLRRIVCVS